jgi:Flp pilus assembly protein TadB
LSALAGGAVVAACLALLGIETGLVAAAVLAPATALGLRHLQRRPVPLRVGVATALALDLAAAALRSGRPVADALRRAAPAADPQVAALLERVAGLLRLGAEPAEAWSVLPSESALGPLAAAATRSAVSGLRLAGTFERTAGELRACAGAAASVRAHRAGVLAMAPLGLCFLPAFVCLGVVPVVVGIARTAGGTFR